VTSQTGSGHFGVQPRMPIPGFLVVRVCFNGIMLLCIVFRCSSRSEWDKDVSFFRIPAVRRGSNDKELQLSKARRDGYVAAISRKDMTESKLENERICSKRFVSSRPRDQRT
jgi:hypothetical protein